MSKLSFRSRQVDYTKPLPIYLNHDLPDLQDFAAINRSVPLMPTGMEKDEEAEHHLQRALSALQAFGATSSNEYAIPTPKVEIDSKLFDRIYNIEFPKQKQYIRIQPFSNDYEYPDYDADYEDENWLNEKKKTLPKEFNQDLLLYFEAIMDRLEKVTSHSNVLMSREEAKLLLLKEANSEDSCDLINSLSNSLQQKQQKYKEEIEQFQLSIYEYWKQKRLNCNHPLTPIVLTDKSGVVTQPNNPYLVFRRRTEKMQTRKNRKNEEQSYEKMLILKRDLCRAQHILKLIKKRENFKKEFLKLTLETFEKRYKLNDFDGTLTDSIACSLKPLINTTTTSSQQANTLSNLLNNSNLNKLNQTNETNKNLSTIDKTIVNLINSNKLKTLNSPPHSSLKKIPQDFLVDSIYKNNNLNSKLCKQLSDKQQKKLKKDKLQQQQHQSNVNQNQTISNIINNNRKLYGDLNDLSANNKITVNNNNSATPLTNRSNNNQLIFDNIRRRTNSTTNSNNRRPVNSNSNSNSSDSSNNRFNENENLDSNNNKNSRNLNHNLYKNKADLINSDLISNQRLAQQQLEDDNLNIIFNEFKEYEDELRLNQIENLDSILNEAKNRLSTTSDKDGYWCFKRKEGCKYLPQNGPIFKNDVIEVDEFLKPSPPHQPAHLLFNANQQTDQTNTTEEIVNNHFYQSTNNNKKQKRLELKKKDRLKELQQFYYGYAITKHNRHLGLVRRRLGRGGRILLDKFNENVIDFKNTKQINRNQSLKKLHEKIQPLNLTKFKTYYPIDCFNVNNIEQIVPNSNNMTNCNNTLETKLKLKNFYETTESTMTEIKNDKITDFINEEDFTYDHRLFSLYQFETNDKLTELFEGEENNSEIITTITKPDDLLITSNTLPIPIDDKIEIDDFDELDDYNSNFNLKINDNTNLINGETKIYDRTNLIRFDFSSALKLNDEYHYSSDECNLNASNIKLAIKTLKIPPKQHINNLITIDIKNEESNDVKLNIESDDKTKLGESIANITSTTLTPPSPSPPPPPQITQTNDSSPNNLFANKDINLIHCNQNDETINNNNNSNINNKILVSLQNNSTANTSIFNNQNQTGRYFQSINKIKSFNYSNDKIMQSLVNGTSSNLSSQSSTTSSSSSPSSSLSPQSYLVKKQTNKINNNTIQKGSSLFYSTSSMPSSSSTSSSSTHSIPTIVITPSTKLASTSSTNLVSITSSMQQTNQNQNNSNNTNAIVVNGVLTKKKDENNPFLLNNNSNFQTFHHQENQITSTTQTSHNSSTNTTNGLIPAQKLLQHFGSNLQNSTNSTNSVSNSSLLFKTTSNNSSPVAIALASSSSNNTNNNNTNDLNNSII